ncbi:ABC transporter transmembrane domain-containing protein, partial [Bacillus licheniformis]
LTINVELALVAVVFVPLLIILIIYSNIRMPRAWRQLYNEIADVNAKVEVSVSGVRVVQSFTNERFGISRFLKSNQKFRKSKLKGYKT